MGCCLQVAGFTQGLAALLCTFTKLGRSLLKAWHLQQMGSSEAVWSCMFVMSSCCKRNCCCCAGGSFYINHAQVSRGKQAPKAPAMLACATHAVWHKEARSIGHDCMQEYLWCLLNSLASQLYGKGKQEEGVCS
jgi:hypothetical protein